MSGNGALYEEFGNMQLVTDSGTNIVFFSEWLKKDFPQLHDELHVILEKHDVPHGTLNFTNDYWCRDYMPIQVSDNVFVRYKYYPDYLLKRAQDSRYITNPDKACEELGISFKKIDIIIDGGNIIKCDNCIIMTEKVFKENPHHKKNQLISMLENVFQVDIVFLPWDEAEEYGHSDGIVRYITDRKVLFTNYKDFDEKMADEMKNRLSKRFEVKELHYSTSRKNPNNWAYINFLQTKQLIIIPRLNTEEDTEAMSQFEYFFPHYQNRIEQVNVDSILKLGGALNCISWNIKK